RKARAAGLRHEPRRLRRPRLQRRRAVLPRTRRTAAAMRHRRLLQGLAPAPAGNLRSARKRHVLRRGQHHAPARSQRSTKADESAKARQSPEGLQEEAKEEAPGLRKAGQARLRHRSEGKKAKGEQVAKEGQVDAREPQANPSSQANRKLQGDRDPSSQAHSTPQAPNPRNRPSRSRAASPAI